MLRPWALACVLCFASACAPAAGPARLAAPPVAKAASSPASPAPAAEPPRPHGDDEAIAKAAQEYLDLFAELHPEEATSLGLHTRDAELDDRSIAGEDRATDRQAALLAQLEKRFANADASASARTDLALLLGTLRSEIRIKRVQRPLQRDPSIYVEPLGAIFQMTARSYAPAPERARNVLARLGRIPATVELARENLLNPPRVWTEIAIAQAGSAKGFLERQRPFLVEALPAETKQVDATLKAAIAAYEDYRTHLQRQVLPRSNGRFAAGRELFEYLLRNRYFLDIGADELLAMGKRVLAETSAEMTEVARKIDPKAKGWPEVTHALKKRHPAAPELLDAYRKEVGRARAFLVAKDAISFPPGDDLEVIETPPFMRSTITAAYDPPPPFDAEGAKGFFFVTPIDPALPKPKQEEMLREHDWGDVVDTAVHEAYPGHHLQYVFARRHPSVLRRALHSAVFSEGWALYSEELMAELGYYDDAQRLMQLEWVLVRAARIVLDVGLHVGDMTFEQAVKVLTDEVHLERSLAVSEVKRYTRDPTQSSAYMIGRQAILALRERARQRDGERFSLKAFHSDLLGRGTVPPSLLAKEMF